MFAFYCHLFLYLNKTVKSICLFSTYYIQPHNFQIPGPVVAKDQQTINVLQNIGLLQLFVIVFSQLSVQKLSKKDFG